MALAEDILSSSARGIQIKLAETREQASKLLKSVPVKKLADGTEAPDFTTEQFSEFKARVAEINDFGQTYDAVIEDERRQKRDEARAAEAERVKLEGKQTPINGISSATQGSQKTIGELLINSRNWKESLSRKQVGDFDIDVDMREYKTTMTTTAGYPPFVHRDGDVVLAIYRPVQILDYLVKYPTKENSIKYMKETTRTSGAAETAENAAFSEATLVFTETSDIVSAIGHILPVTEEELEDDTVVRSLIDTELVNMVWERLDQQVVTGNGTAPNLRGISNATGIQTQAQGANTLIDTIALGIKNVNLTGRGFANVVALNTADFWVTALKKDTTGRYLLVDPGVTPQLRIWGLPIALCDSLTAGTGLVFDTRFFQVAMRKGITMAVSDSHASNFASRVLAIRAHLRAGIKRRRDEAACKLTGLS